MDEPLRECYKAAEHKEKIETKTSDLDVFLWAEALPASVCWMKQVFCFPKKMKKKTHMTIRLTTKTTGKERNHTDWLPLSVKWFKTLGQAEWSKQLQHCLH